MSSCLTCLGGDALRDEGGGSATATPDAEGAAGVSDLPAP